MKVKIIVVVLCHILYFKAFSQTYKFRFLDVTTNQFVNNIIVIPEFERCDYVSSPLLYNKEGKFYYYKNKSYPNPPKTKFTLLIESPEYYFPGCPISGCMFSVDPQLFDKDGNCVVKVCPTVRINITNTDTSLFADISIRIKAKCNEIEGKLYYTDKMIYSSSQCTAINDSISNFKFPLINEAYTLNSIRNDSLTFEISSEKSLFTSKVFSFNLSENIAEINISIPSMEVKVTRLPD